MIQTIQLNAESITIKNASGKITIPRDEVQQLMKMIKYFNNATVFQWK